MCVSDSVLNKSFPNPVPMLLEEARGAVRGTRNGTTGTGGGFLPQSWGRCRLSFSLPSGFHLKNVHTPPFRAPRLPRTYALPRGCRSAGIGSPVQAVFRGTFDSGNAQFYTPERPSPRNQQIDARPAPPRAFKRHSGGDPPLRRRPAVAAVSAPGLPPRKQNRGNKTASRRRILPPNRSAAAREVRVTFRGNKTPFRKHAAPLPALRGGSA